MSVAIRIDDLRTPQLTPGQRAGIHFGDAVTTVLTVDAVLEAASQRIGLANFGNDDFRERLGLWLSEVDEDEQRTGLGRMLLFNDCVRYASNRLLINELLGAHPEIHDVKIIKPIIVVGLPRSGTTHLVNLLAADSRLRSMPLWEGQEPVANPREKTPAHGIDPRWIRCNNIWQAMQDNAPLVAAMHPMAPDHIHEELELILPNFSSYNQEWTGRVPKWRDYYLAHDQTEHYQYLLTGLKILQWYSPRERWVLKSPQHLEQLGPLLTTFPDATVVMTHRDPVAVIQSAATMMAYSARMSYRTPQPEWYLDYWTDRVQRLLDASVRDRHLLPGARTTDVLFHEFMADDMGTVERIYEVADLAMTTQSRQELLSYIDAHPRGKDGQIIYDLRSDFGATPADVRAGFSQYLNLFPTRLEVD